MTSSQARRNTARIRASNNRCREPTHDIWSVKVKGDPPKSFRLALGTEHSAGFVQSLERSVILRFNTGAAEKLEGFGGFPKDRV